MRNGVAALALLLLGTVCAQAGPPVTESLIHSGEGCFTLVSDDGAALTLRARDGHAVSLDVGETPFRLAPGPLVYFEEVVALPDAPDLLRGMSPGAWGMPEDALDGDEGWLTVRGGGEHPKQTLVLDQENAEPLVLSGWCRTELSAAALGWWSRWLALNATGTYRDGGQLPEVSAWFGQYQHDAQFSQVVVCPDRPLGSLDLELTALPGDCTASYRDVQLRPAAYRRTTPDSAVRRIDARLLQEYESTEAGLRSWITYQATASGIEIRGVLDSIRPEDRAISAYVTLPVDALGGRWHDHFRAARAIEAGKRYRDESATWYYGAGRDGRNSLYPLACVDTPDGQGLAVCTPMDEPRLFQMEYDAAARALRVRFDLGLSPDAGRHANRASFTARIFAYDVADGFRGATARYYAMYPWAFARRAERGGTWLAFLSPSFVPGGPEGFHFQFVEAMADMGWEEREGMYSLRYTLPITHVHEFPGHIDAPEVHGPALPARSLELAARIPELPGLPLDMYRRYPAYPGAHSADPWGQPNGFFFRSNTGGRNDNMMLTNANAHLPASPGAPFSFAGYEMEQTREAMAVPRQWHVPGWRMGRVLYRSFFEIEEGGATRSSGKSLRLNVVEGKNYFEQHARSLSQTVYVDLAEGAPVTVALMARCGQEQAGTAHEPRCSLTFWGPDGKQERETFALTPLGNEWQPFRFTTEAPGAVSAVEVLLDFANDRANPLEVWFDDVQLTAGGGPNLLRNGGFEEAELLPCRLDGLYLDVIGGYWGDMDYRRDHWQFAESPLTFDYGRAPTLLQIHTHVTFARQMADRLHPQDMLLFGNCVPTTPFMAPYLDILGDEQFWKHGEDWQPKPDAWFNWARFMSGAKPYNILQYSNLTLEEQERYMNRCLFYGVFPSNQADPEGKWFWANPLSVKRVRPLYARLVPHIQALHRAGWQPLTFAVSDNENIWLERFGEGEAFYLTVFNPSGTAQRATVKLDARAGAAASARLEERLSGATPAWGPDHTFAVELGPEAVAVYRISAT